VEDRGLDVGAPSLGERNLRGFVLLGHVGLQGIVFSLAPLKISITSAFPTGFDRRSLAQESLDQRTGGETFSRIRPVLDSAARSINPARRAVHADRPQAGR
jgi:hypothetical protein